MFAEHIIQFISHTRSTLRRTHRNSSRTRGVQKRTKTADSLRTWCVHSLSIRLKTTIQSCLTHPKQANPRLLNLQVVQITPHTKTYSGSPSSKNFDGDVALTKTVSTEYAATQLRRDTLTSTSTGVITSRKPKAVSRTTSLPSTTMGTSPGRTRSVC